jgi:outer membrane protein assembly factor BamA
VTHSLARQPTGGARAAAVALLLCVCPVTAWTQDAAGEVAEEEDSPFVELPEGQDPPGAELSRSVMDATAQAGVWGARVAEIVMVLPQGLDQGTAEQLLGIRRGDPLDASAVRRGVKRLVLLAKADDVRVWAVPLPEGPDSVRLVVRLIPAEVIREVRFEGLADVAASDVRRDLTVNEGDVFDERTAEMVREGVVVALAQEGYPRAQVEVTSVPLGEDGSSVALVVTAKLGRPLKTSAIRFEGDTRFPPWQLRNRISLGTGGLASRSRMERTARELLAWYRSQGHWSARIEPQPIVPDEKARSAPLVFKITAGPRWVVAFRGNRVMPSWWLRQRLDLPPDRRLDGEAVVALEDKLVNAYREAGYYHARVRGRAAPGTERGTRRLLFLVHEGQFTTLKSVKLDGVKSMPRKQLEDEAVLAAAEDLPASPTVAQRLDPADVDAILTSGDSELEHRPRRESPHVGRGAEWPRSVTGLLDREQVYDDRRFTKGGRAVEDVYKSRGFLQARVQGPSPAWQLDGALVDVRYKVVEGVQTRIKSVSFRDNVSIPSSDLLRIARDAVVGSSRVDPGQPLDLFAVEEARLAILKHYADEGYPFADAQDAIQYEPGRKEAHLSFVVTEGERVRVKDVEIFGNDVTQRVVVSAQLALSRGQLYRKRDVDGSRRRILNTGLFSSVTIGLKENESGPERTALVQVRERKFGDAEVGIGASFEQGPRGFVGVSWRNLFGLGITTGLRGRINWPWPMYVLGLIDPKLRDKILGRFDTISFPYVPDGAMRIIRPAFFTEAEGVATLGYPKLFFMPLDTGLRAELVGQRANRRSFTMTKTGLIFTADLKAPPLRYLRASSSPSAGLQGTQLNCYLEKTALDSTGRTCEGDETRRLDNGLFGLWTMRMPLTLDGRDNIFRPHAGYLFTSTADVVLGGGSLYALGKAEGSLKRSTFVRLAAGLSVYLPFTKYLTLALALRGGTIVPLGPRADPANPRPGDLYIPLFERFYLGGSDSVRGFAPDAVLVSDDSGSNARDRPVVSQGGSSFWNTRSELRIPLTGPVEIGLFMDAGQLSREWIDFRGLDFSAFSMGLGAGLRVITPVGPLILDLGFGVKDGARDFDDQGRYRVAPEEIPRRIVPHPALGYF